MTRLVWLVLACSGLTASARTLSVDLNGMNNPDAGTFVSLQAALAAVSSNDVVLVAQGNYDAGVSYTCSGATDVTVRSTMPRRARFSGLTLASCSRWSIEDFFFDQPVTLGEYATNDFNGRFVGNLVSVSRPSASGDYALTVYGAANALFEGNELRAQNAYVAFFDGTRPVLRRNYVVGDGAYGLHIYATGALVENNVIEGALANGLSLFEPGQVFGNLIRVNGAAVELRPNLHPVRDLVFRNNVLSSGGVPFLAHFARGLTFEFNTAIRASGDAIDCSELESTSVDLSPALTIKRSAIRGEITVAPAVGADAGVYSIQDSIWVLPNGSAPAGTIVKANVAATPFAVTGCLAYGMRLTVDAGQSVGAEVLYRTVDGGLTTELLWSGPNGEFPCGAVVPSVNDFAGTNCLTAHQRFGVNLPACPLPRTDAGASDAGAPDAGPTDAGPRDAGSTDAGSTDAGSIDAGAVDAGSIDAGAVDAGAIDAGAIDAGSMDAGSSDAGSSSTDAGRTDGGATPHKPRFTSVPKFEAMCGGPYTTKVSADTGAVLALEQAPEGAVLSEGTLTWSNPTGRSAEFLVSATSPTGERSTQRFTVAVDCPTVGCSTSAAALVPLLSLLLRRRRLARRLR